LPSSRLIANEEVAAAAWVGGSTQSGAILLVEEYE